GKPNLAESSLATQHGQRIVFGHYWIWNEPIMNFSYQQQTLASANPIELVVALYDGAIRFLRQAIAAVEVNDVRGRRKSVKFALDIFLHLQSRLRYDVDARVAGNFSQFYIEMFRHTLLA